MLVLSVAAFLLLPRGDSSAVGYQEVAALPITGDPEFSPAPVELATLPQGGAAPVRVRRGLTACGDRRLQRAGERRS